MYKIKRRIIWFLFISMGLSIIILNGSLNKKYFINFCKQFKELLKKKSKYI